MRPSGRNVCTRTSVVYTRERAQSGRRNGIASRFDLPRHRAYRSVHGGSLIYGDYFYIVIGKECVAGFLQIPLAVDTLALS
jgi:hypothetical protein